MPANKRRVYDEKKDGHHLTTCCTCKYRFFEAAAIHGDDMSKTMCQRCWYALSEKAKRGFYYGEEVANGPNRLN